MRARYSAFALGDVDYVLASHHTATRDQVDRDEIERWSKGSEWLGLRILETEGGGEGDDEGTVTFRARYRMAGQLVDHRELATFQREDGEWRFLTGVEGVEPQPELAPVTAAATIGRNDPCTCGSGRKFKKCCGAVA